MRVYRLTSIAPLALALATATLAATLVATTAQAQPQDRDQRRCIHRLDKAGTGVVRTQGKIVSGCIKNALKGREIAPQSCLRQDPRGKLAEARRKVATACVGATPDFAVATEQKINCAATENVLAFVADLYGPNLNTAIDVSHKATGRCQAAVYKSMDKYVRIGLKYFAACMKRVLCPKTCSEEPQTPNTGCTECGTGYANNAEELAESCHGFWIDNSGKLLRIFSRLYPGGAVAKKCAAAEQATSCARSDECVNSSPGAETEACVATCLVTQAVCRTCEISNDLHSLSSDCDTIDDGLANASCLPVVVTCE